MVSCSNQKI